MNYQSKRLPQTPLVLALMQIRFTAVLKMEDYLPSIQEVFRKGGFPHFKEEIVQRLNFGPKLSQSESKRWAFYNGSRTTALFLTSDFVVFAQSQYDVFETFLEQANFLIKHIVDIAELSLGVHAGLRYVNALGEIDGIQPSEQMQPSLQGLAPSALGLKNMSHQWLLHGDTEAGSQLVVRSYDSDPGTLLPPDLQIDELKLPERPLSDSYRILDIDHLNRKDFDLSSDALTTMFTDMHIVSKQAFENSVSPKALNAWRQE